MRDEGFSVIGERHMMRIQPLQHFGHAGRPAHRAAHQAKGRRKRILGAVRARLDGALPEQVRIIHLRRALCHQCRLHQQGFVIGESCQALVNDRRRQVHALAPAQRLQRAGKPCRYRAGAFTKLGPTVQCRVKIVAGVGDFRGGPPNAGMVRKTCDQVGDATLGFVMPAQPVHGAHLGQEAFRPLRPKQCQRLTRLQRPHMFPIALGNGNACHQRPFFFGLFGC